MPVQNSPESPNFEDIKESISDISRHLVATANCFITQINLTKGIIRNVDKLIDRLNKLESVLELDNQDKVDEEEKN